MTPAAAVPTHRAPRRDAAENRVAILDAAAAVLNRDPDAPLETIAAAAGLSRRAIYGHFSTRDELVAELSTRGIERVTAALAPIRHPDSRVAIALIGARLWAEVENVRVMAQLTLRGPDRNQLATRLAPIRDVLLQAVERGAAAQQLRTDIPPPTLARLIEGSALSVLDEAVRYRISRVEGHRLVMLATLSTVGLSWREAGELIATTPELRIERKTTTAKADPTA